MVPPFQLITQPWHAVTSRPGSQCKFVWLYHFLRTAITSYNKPDGLIEHKFTLTYLWNSKIQYQFHRAKIQVSLGLYLEAVLESLSLPPPADVILGSHQFLLIPLHLLFCVSQVSSG